MFVALVIGHAKSMCRIVLLSVACPTLPYLPHYVSHKRHDVRKESYWTKLCIFIFPTAFVWNCLIIRKISARYYHKFTGVFMHCTGNSYQILMKIEFLRKIFQKYSNVNPSSGSRVVKCGVTDRHDEGNSSFFRNFSKELKISAVVTGGSHSAVRCLFPGELLAHCFHQHSNAIVRQEDRLLFEWCPVLIWSGLLSVFAWLPLFSQSLHVNSRKIYALCHDSFQTLSTI
jgi:hypothetical protein